MCEDELGEPSEDEGEPASDEEFEDSYCSSTRYESDGGEEMEYDMDQWTYLINREYNDVPAEKVVDVMNLQWTSHQVCCHPLK